MNVISAVNFDRLAIVDLPEEPERIQPHIEQLAVCGLADLVNNLLRRLRRGLLGRLRRGLLDRLRRGLLGRLRRIRFGGRIRNACSRRVGRFCTAGDQREQQQSGKEQGYESGRRGRRPLRFGAQVFRRRTEGDDGTRGKRAICRRNGAKRNGESSASHQKYVFRIRIKKAFLIGREEPPPDSFRIFQATVLHGL